MQNFIEQYKNQMIPIILNRMKDVEPNKESVLSLFSSVNVNPNLIFGMAKYILLTDQLEI